MDLLLSYVNNNNKKVKDFKEMKRGMLCMGGDMCVFDGAYFTRTLRGFYI